ncbi:MAG: secondary thiamine-phosphate synthase enzyme YjbQ [Candidatus Omnitrophota bacterium]|nr:secondary thiamine-phosphate synthase enzyme YjbQ [Candidatus Omnitrophota bacterium]
MKTLAVPTKEKCQFVDITSSINQYLREQKVDNGICVVFCPHTTAALTINENADPSVKKDIIKHLNKIVPENGSYDHREGNSDAHIKSSLLGSSLNIIIEKGKLVLGTWQGIYFCEFDGPRDRQVYVKIV